MFAPHCPACDRRVLLGPRRVLGISEDGRVLLRCHCGAAVEWTATPSPALELGGAALAEGRDAVGHVGGARDELLGDGLLLEGGLPARL